MTVKEIKDQKESKQYSQRTLYAVVFFGLILIIIAIVIPSVLLAQTYAPQNREGSHNELELQFDNFMNKLERKEPFSFAHFNDGEFFCINKGGTVGGSGGLGLWTDKCTQDVINTYLEILKNPPPNYYIGLPCKLCHSKERQKANELTESHRSQTVEAMVFHHTRYFYKSFDKLTEALKDRSIYLVVSEQAQPDRYFNKHYTVKEVLYVDKNYATRNFDKYKDKSFENNSVILLCCGPLGRMLSGIWTKNNPTCTILCLGSYFDQELYGKHFRNYMDGTHKYCSSCFPYKRLH